MANIHISVVPEEIFEIGGLSITNTMLGAIIVWSLILLAGLIVRLNIKQTGSPGKLQSIVEAFYVLMENMANDVLGRTRARKYLGLVLVTFLFILGGSWIGLVPGMLQLGFEHHGHFVHLLRAPTTDLNATIALAIIAFFTIQFSGFSELGLGYLSKFFQFKHGIINSFIGILELISEVTRILSFSFRLFGNIFAGEVLLIVMIWLSNGVPVPTAVILMEFFVAIIQSYVFVNLMSIYVSMAAMPAEH